MKIKVKDEKIEGLKNYAKDRLERIDRGENTTMCELGQQHELRMLIEELEKYDAKQTQSDVSCL